MRAPYRKPGIYSQMKPDNFLTAEKLVELEKKLERLKLSQPFARSEVSRLAELGDFSENTEYQMAKWKLRGINGGILALQKQIDNAIIIENNTASDKVRLGSTVTVEFDNKIKTYQILGASETDPKKGIISHLSPIGQALLNKKINEEFSVKLADKEVKYKIVKIN